MKRLLLRPALLACASAPAENLGNGTAMVGSGIVVAFTSRGTFALDGGAGGSGVVVIRWFAPKGTVILIKQPDREAATGRRRSGRRRRRAGA
jgi:hypothetical protein